VAVYPHSDGHVSMCTWPCIYVHVAVYPFADFGSAPWGSAQRLVMLYGAMQDICYVVWSVRIISYLSGSEKLRS
jgi:hypothetical protein